MNDMTAVFASLAIIEKQYREMAERVRALEQQRAEDRERLFQGALLSCDPCCGGSWSATATGIHSIAFKVSQSH